MRNKTHNRRGFTLIELLIVIIIIGVIAGLVYIAIGPSDAKAKAAECLGEREKIKTEYSVVAFGSRESFKSRFESEIKSVAQANKHEINEAEASFDGLCKSGGTYTVWPVTSSSIAIRCSIHGGDEKTSSTGGGNSDETKSAIPGTGSFGGTVIDAADDWTAGVSGNTITVKKGQKYYYNGKYYVATEDDSIYAANTDPDVTVNAVWWNTKSSGGIIQTTGVCIDYSTVKIGDEFHRGDIVYYDGNYYICMVGYSDTTVLKLNAYNIRTPLSSEVANLWFKLENT